MKLDAASIAYIQNTVKTAKTIGLDNVVIEPGWVRGVDEGRSRVLLHTKDVPALPFGSIAINRLNVFTDRVDIGNSMADFSIDVTTHGEDPTILVTKENPKAMFASALHLKAKGMKLDYKCSNPLIIKSPRSLNDKLKYRMQMTAEAVHYMLKGKTAFDTDEVSLLASDGVVSIEMVDINNDKMTYELVSSIDREIEGDKSPISFNQRFPLSIMLPLFKLNPNSHFYVSEKAGFIQMEVNNLTVCIFPRV